MGINDFKSQSGMKIVNQNVWQCKYCGALSFIGPIPPSGCPAKNGGYHIWMKVQ